MIHCSKKVTKKLFSLSDFLVAVLETIDNYTEVVQLKYGAQVCLLKYMRDFVLLRHYHHCADGSYLLIGTSIEHPAAKLDDGYIRGQVFVSGYVAKPKVNSIVSTKLIQVA